MAIQMEAYFPYEREFKGYGMHYTKDQSIQSMNIHIQEEQQNIHIQEEQNIHIQEEQNIHIQEEQNIRYGDSKIQAPLSDEYVPYDVTYLPNDSDDDTSFSISSYDSKREPLFPDEDPILRDFGGSFRIATPVSIHSLRRRSTIDSSWRKDPGPFSLATTSIELSSSPLTFRGREKSRAMNTGPSFPIAISRVPSLSSCPSKISLASLSPPSMTSLASVMVSPKHAYSKPMDRRPSVKESSRDSKWRLVRYLASFSEKAGEPEKELSLFRSPAADDLVSRLAAVVPTDARPASGTELTMFAMRASEAGDSDVLELSKLEARRRFKNRDQRVNSEFLRLYAMDYNARVNEHTLPNVGDAHELNTMISRRPGLKEFHYNYNLVHVSTMSRDKLWNSVILPARSDPSPQQVLPDHDYVQVHIGRSLLVRKDAKHVPWSLGTRGIRPVGARGVVLANGLAPNSGVTREQYVVRGWCPRRLACNRA